jgi:hypothetical protein
MDLDLYIAVAAGAFLGMLWPVIVALLRKMEPDFPIAASSSQLQVAVTHSNLMAGWIGAASKIVLWLFLCAFVAAVIAALNIVPLVTGDAAEDLKKLGGWEYFFLAAEGFGLASFFEEGIKPKK